MVAFVLSIGLLIGLMFKRKEHPTNMYLLLAFVSFLPAFVFIPQQDCDLYSKLNTKLFRFHLRVITWCKDVI